MWKLGHASDVQALIFTQLGLVFITFVISMLLVNTSFVSETMLRLNGTLSLIKYAL